MALVKGPAGGIAASGTIGGQVYARNRAGQYARAWAKPVNPNTVRQAQVRSMFGNSSTNWALLSDSDIEAWDAYAAQLVRINRLGEPYTPKGRQIFMEVTQNLQTISQTLIATPSGFTESPSMDSIATFIATETAGVLDGLDTTNIKFLTPSGADGYVVVEATPPYEVKKTNVNNLFRQITVLAGPNPIAASNLLAAYTAVFGTAALAGQLIQLRAKVVDEITGLASSWYLIKAAIT